MVDEGVMKGSSPTVALHINKNINVFLLMERIKTELRHFEYEYSLNDYFGEVYIGWKEWINDNEYNKSLSQEKVDKILNDVLIDDNKNKIRKIQDEVIDGKVFEYINSKFPTMKTIEELSTIDQLGINIQGGVGIDSIEKLGKLNDLKNEVIGYIKYFNNKDRLVEEYNIPRIAFNNSIENIDKLRDVDKKNIDVDPRLYDIKNVYLSNYKGIDVFLFVYEKIKNKVDDDENVSLNKGSKEYKYYIVDYDNWEEIIKGWYVKRNNFIKWTDVLVNNQSTFKRIIKPYNLYIDVFNGKVEFLERMYDFPDIILPYNEKEYNDNFGSLDIETAIEEDNENLTSADQDNFNNIEDIGLGRLAAYAASFKIKRSVYNTEYLCYYIIDNKDIKNSEDLFKIMFDKLFEVIINKCTIWSHNLGQFDSIFLIKILIKLGYEVSPYGKMIKY
jgi:hypothetical protein